MLLNAAFSSVRAPAVPTATPLTARPRPVQPAAHMASLRDIRGRIKSVASIGKITASMKMVAAARLRIAELTLKNIARPFAHASNKPLLELFEAQTNQDTTGKRQLVVVTTSDRGLCGSINTAVIKGVKADYLKESAENVRFAVAGTKGKAGLIRDRGDQISQVCIDLAKRLPTNFSDVLMFAEGVARTGDIDNVVVYHQRFVSLLTNEMRRVVIPSREALLRDVDTSKYEFDEMKETTLDNLYEWYVATTLFGAITEHSTAELGARMSAMDGATKNSQDMLSRLTIEYNRRRQAAITTELCEIVAGAESLKG